jgi:nucleoid-associated protein Lsr2
MAQATRVRLVDDLDGGNADESVDFTVDNNRYQMDLSEKTPPGYAKSSHPSSPPHAAPAAQRQPAPGAAPPLPAHSAQVRKPRPSANGQA